MMDASNTTQNVRVLLASIFVVALCSITYELIVGTLSSYLLGNSVLQFSVIIGLYMSAMGVGSYLSRFIENDLLDRFLWVEIGVGVLGGTSSAALFGLFAYFPWFQYAIWVWTFAVGVLVGLEIPLLTRHLRQYDQLRIALANVLSWDYIGALGGSLIFPLVLLPNLGLLNTSATVGLLNLCVALGGVLFFRNELRHPRRLLFASSAAAIGLGILMSVSGSYESFLDRRLFTDPVVFKKQTPYQNLTLTAWKDDLRLFINGNIQFSSIDEYRYHESLVHPVMYAVPHAKRVAVLGGGDGLAVRELLKFPQIQEIMLIDLDPAMTDLGLEHPAIRRLNKDSLHDRRVKLVHEDAFKFLVDHRHPFDVIIADLPDPNNEGLAKLYSVEFFRVVRQRLRPGGAFVTQSTSPYFARRAFWSINHGIEEAFCEVECDANSIIPYHVWVPSFGDWGFNLAALRPLQPESWPFDKPAEYLNAETFATARSFSPDIEDEDAKPSRLMAPSILGYYLHDWARFNP